MMLIRRLGLLAGGVVFGLGAVAALLLALTAPAEAGSPAAPAVDGATVASLSAGGTMCAVMSDGALLCWGPATSAYIGDGSTSARYVPVDVTTSGVQAAASGAIHTCALDTGGAVRCWGQDTNNNLGNGALGNSTVPTDVVGLSSGVTHIASGWHHTCAIVGGGAKCWGYNASGQLGAAGSPNVPVDVTGLDSGVTHVAAGDDHSCAVVSGGAKCWGANFSGHLGNNSTTPSSTPVDVDGLGANIAAVAAGANHSCALTTGGAVWCWGSDQYGQLGNGNSVTTTQLVPSPVTGLGSGVAAIGAANFHTCALTTGGGVKCWGRNSEGQLGIGGAVSSTVPADVPGLTSGVTTLSVGRFTSCAVAASGSVQCWGDGLRTANGLNTATATTPVTVVGLPEYCLFTGVVSNNWADARNWSNCGGTVPGATDAALAGRPAASSSFFPNIPQVYPTTTVNVHRLRLIGAVQFNNRVVAEHLSTENFANDNGNFFNVTGAGPLSVTTRLTWTTGTAQSLDFHLPAGAVGTATATPGVTSRLQSRLYISGTLNISGADIGTPWTVGPTGVLNILGSTTCCSTSGGRLNNYGTINVSGAPSRVPPIYQFTGTLNLQGGTITGTTNEHAASLYGGQLIGTGVITDMVYNHGAVVAPGGLGSTGAITIGDRYEQSPTATLHIDIGGTAPGSYDSLSVVNLGGFYQGRAALDGTLTVAQHGGFNPPASSDIRFLTFGNRFSWFATVNNAFAPAFEVGAFTEYAALVPGDAALGLFTKPDAALSEPGDNNGYTLLVENPFPGPVTVQAITYTLPAGFTYRAGTAGSLGNPTITTVSGRQQLVWQPNAPVAGTTLGSFSFGVAITTSLPNGVYTSTAAVRTSASPQNVVVAEAAPVLVQTPAIESSGFDVAGSLNPRPGQPPMLSLPRGNQGEWFLVTTEIGCPPGQTCNDPATDLLSVTLRIAGYTYTMTAGEAPADPPTSALAAHAALRPNDPTWANPPKYFRWEPGVPCDQQLPEHLCDPGPDNPYRTDECPIPIVIEVHWANGDVTHDIIGCMALYDPSGFVRDAISQQPVVGASVTLYRVPFALPDNAQETRDCRTVDTRPGDDWDSLPPANLADGVAEDPSLTPPRLAPMVNPQLTDAAGHYGWDVSQGCWFVVVSAPGYLTKISALVGVPPAVTDLHINLTPESAVNVYLPLLRR